MKVKEQCHCMLYSIMDSLNCSVIACMFATLPLHSLPPVSLHYTAVGEPTNVTVTLGERSIFTSPPTPPSQSPPSEGSPLSYTVTWTGRGVTASHVLPPTALNYTIRRLDSNTAYLGALKVCENTANVTAPWDQYTLPQGELYTGGHGVPEKQV